MPLLDPAPKPLTTTLAAGRNIPWLLTTRATQRPDHPFLIWEPFDGPGRTWTYREFEYHVRRLASGLQKRGIAPGDKIVIHLENCPDFLFSWFACAYVGAIAVCTNTRSSALELTYFGEHSQAVAAITQPRLAPVVQQALPNLRWIAVTSRDADESAGSGLAPERSATLDAVFSDSVDSVQPTAGPFDPAWIQYTSGTTSRPKAVVLTHA
ncbi:MAG: AMP-binding protein, partial [Sciscionella sp.]